MARDDDGDHTQHCNPVNEARSSALWDSADAEALAFGETVTDEELSAAMEYFRLHPGEEPEVPARTKEARKMTDAELWGE